MTIMDELDRFARDYYLAPGIADHRIENRMQRDSAPRILAHLPSSGPVLELGYGDGLITQALQDAGVEAELLEGSGLLCDRARARHGERLPIHHDLFESFSPAYSYGAVLALHVLEHLHDPVQILARVAGWLTPGGVAILVVPNRASIHRRVAVGMGMIPALDTLSPRDQLVGHRRVYDMHTLEQHAVAAGLEPETRFGSFLKTLPNSMMLQLDDTLLTAIDGISDDLPPEILANIGLVARKPR